MVKHCIISNIYLTHRWDHKNGPGSNDKNVTSVEASSLDADHNHDALLEKLDECLIPSGDDAINVISGYLSKFWVREMVFLSGMSSEIALGKATTFYHKLLIPFLYFVSSLPIRRYCCFLSLNSCNSKSILCLQTTNEILTMGGDSLESNWNLVF